MSILKWNEDLYKKIEDKVNKNMPVLEFKAEYNILDEKYSPLVKEVEEEYFVHPDGPYNGTKSEMKKDITYISKSLIKKSRKIKFYGDAIQKAINDASFNGGGKVVIKGSDDSQNPNVYYTGAIYIKSNIELHIEENAILKFVRNKSNEFYPLVYTRWEGIEMMNFSPFIYSYEENNIAITGKGILDGCADEFNWMPWKFGYFNEEDQQIQRERLFNMGQEGVDVRTERIFSDGISTIRPPFIQPYKTNNILIRDITILNSPFWEVNPVLCENIKVSGIRIDTNLYNNDGVDPESCKDMIIENCYFLTGDDCIAIKSGRNNEGRNIGIPTSNIIIRNNEFKDGHGGITIGSEISGGVNNIFGHDNYFDSEELDYPIRFKTNAERGGLLENIYIKNSTVNKSKVAVIHADFFYEEGINGNHKPILRNIALSNIKTVDGGSIDAKNALYLKGFEDAPIENILIEDALLNGVKGEAVLQNIKNLTFRNVYINGKKLEDKSINVDNNSKIV
ncbi:glycoside hydrolase family 28 protein [Clostridium saccharoperbutylacetonicum]|uniref:glycoside hydrolase family 28 protein n=1 Tax=Clostridium saccharoperbutylacetonicum TaxID=36745 RepID=UPI000983EC62|nr:glycoside hydrolase family 28 protein [Clostridium saccharoperbutylacetonicum]AQR95789.1 polygalacturonase [Clostridium saccharoperbutylacetonicum]NSB31652.1 polygalacturonase [Clostridium saccharoperbutylacetonicum]